MSCNRAVNKLFISSEKTCCNPSKCADVVPVVGFGSTPHQNQAIQLRMRGVMNATQPRLDTAEPKSLWSVVVVYDDASTRLRAMTVCDHLVRQFLAEVEFTFHWWRTDFLDDPGMAAAAAANAVNAEFIVVCCAPDGELTTGVQHWFEAWTARRAGREGALLDLTESDTASSRRGDRTKAYLREAAHRAAMDYLASLPPAMAGTLPDTFESAALRAGKVTSVLDDILRQSPPPSHFGLNE